MSFFTTLHRVPALLLWSSFSIAIALGAAPSDVLDAKTIWAKVEAAAGPPLNSEARVTEFTANGLAGTEVYQKSGDDWRETIRHGPFQYSDGQAGGQAWSQNENGQTVYDQPDPGKAAVDPTTETVQRVTQPFDAYVISNLNLRGYGTKDYVEPVTWRVVRRDLVEATGTTVVVYDDFRATGGHFRAWHWTIRDGHPEDDRQYRITSDDASPVAPAAVSILDSRRNLVDLPAGKKTDVLPVGLAYGKFMVRVTINGRGLDFVLDTGAGAIVMDEDVARQLRLPLYAPESSAVNAGRYTSETTIVSEMDVGDFEDARRSVRTSSRCSTSTWTTAIRRSTSRREAICATSCTRVTKIASCRRRRFSGTPSGRARNLHRPM